MSKVDDQEIIVPDRFAERPQAARRALRLALDRHAEAQTQPGSLGGQHVTQWFAQMTGQRDDPLDALTAEDPKLADDDRNARDLHQRLGPTSTDHPARARPGSTRDDDGDRHRHRVRRSTVAYHVTVGTWVVANRKPARAPAKGRSRSRACNIVPSSGTGSSG